MDSRFLIRPLQTVEEHQALIQAGVWIWYQHRVEWRHEIILALEGSLIAGYCVIEVDQPRERRAVVLAALESRRPGARRALLHALKARARAILVEDVPRSAVNWLRRQGFVPSSVQPAWPKERGPDVAGDLIWHRWDDAAFDDIPLEPLWPEGVALGRPLAQGTGG